MEEHLIIMKGGRMDLIVSEDSILNNDEISPLSLLELPIELQYGFSLRDYFLLIHNYPDFQEFNIYFNSYLETFYSENKIGCANACDYLNLNIQYSYIKDIQTPIEEEKNIYKKRKKKLNIEHFISFEGRWNENEDTLDICLTPLSEILDLPIKISNNMMTSSKTIQNENEYKEEHATNDASLNLFEFITGIIGEISLYGEEEERLNIAESIKNSIDLKS